MAPTVFLDTCVLRHAADRRIVPTTHVKSLNWGGRECSVNLVRWVPLDPNARLDNRFRAHLSLLPLIAHLARRSRLALLTHHEVRWELAGLPPANDPRGLFYGAPIGMAGDPFTYSRILASASMDADALWVHNLLALDDPQFVQLQKATGARQGDTVNANQLLDAFHILTAERAHAEFFLTTDLKLVRSIRAQPRHAPTVAIVNPSQLLSALIAGRQLRIRDVLSFFVFQLRTRGAGPVDHPLEQLRSIGDALDQADRRPK
jgi:hypothetical protein